MLISYSDLYRIVDMIRSTDKSIVYNTSTVKDILRAWLNRLGLRYTTEQLNDLYKQVKSIYSAKVAG